MFKIVVLGSGGVGKSSLTSQFVSNQFNDLYDPTIQDCYRTSLKINNSEITLDIFDTSGTENFASFRDLDIQKGNGFLLVYSIISHSTFNDLFDIGEQIYRAKKLEEISLLIVGNKSDLENLREVEKNEGIELAKKFNAEFLETSAKLRVNVDQVFERLSMKMIQKQSTNAIQQSKQLRNKKGKCVLL